jgi:hypothetical protein
MLSHKQGIPGRQYVLASAITRWLAFSCYNQPDAPTLGGGTGHRQIQQRAIRNPILARGRFTHRGYPQMLIHKQGIPSRTYVLPSENSPTAFPFLPVTAPVLGQACDSLDRRIHTPKPVFTRVVVRSEAAATLQSELARMLGSARPTNSLVDLLRIHPQGKTTGSLAGLP